MAFVLVIGKKWQALKNDRPRRNRAARKRPRVSRQRSLIRHPVPQARENEVNWPWQPTVYRLNHTVQQERNYGSRRCFNDSSMRAAQEHDAE